MLPMRMVRTSAIASCATFLLLPQFDVTCDLLLSWSRKPDATAAAKETINWSPYNTKQTHGNIIWNLLVKYTN